jgi:pimeloyl-ACP methyl ester carboxylesterase
MHECTGERGLMTYDQLTGTVILIHGFFRTGRDMHRLRDLLGEYGWRTCALTVPARFGTLEDCVRTLEKKIAGISSGAERIHLVGHSFGGLVIRAFLARNRLPNRGRCVLIGTPNRGACLADLEVKLIPGIKRVVKPLRALVTTAAPLPPPLDSPSPEIGVIASDNSRLLGGLLIPGKNDGRVELSSTPLDGMTDYTLVSFVHTKMHKRRETAGLVDHFLRTGEFR